MLCIDCAANCAAMMSPRDLQVHANAAGYSSYPLPGTVDRLVGCESYVVYYVF